MDKEKSERLVLNMVNFYMVFEKEFKGLIPEIEAEGITPLLSKALNEIHLQGRTTAKELGERLGLSVSNTSRTINTLDKYGYIERKKCEKDKRIVYLTLSIKGFGLITRFLEAYQERFFEKLERADEDQLDIINESFENLRHFFEKL